MLTLFLDLSTQWRIAVGLGGTLYLGLAYSEATNLMKERGWPRARRTEALDDLRVMERAALSLLNARGDG